MNAPAALDLEAIGARLAGLVAAPAEVDPEEVLALGEAVLEHWVRARDKQPTREEREGFRLLALHRQGADKNPSFNACRETCRELAYHYNLLTQQSGHEDRLRRQRMMALVANHLFLFIAGKMETEQLGDFCCSSKPLRTGVDAGEIAGSE